VVWCCTLQARLQEATRQLSGGGSDGLSFREVRQRLAESEGKLMKAARAEEEQAAKVRALRCISCTRKSMQRNM
jgi:hypothetical protein